MTSYDLPTMSREEAFELRNRTAHDVDSALGELQRAAPDDPLAKLTWWWELSVRCQDLAYDAADDARDAGRTWSDIGVMVDRDGAAARQRFTRRSEQRRATD